MSCACRKEELGHQILIYRSVPITEIEGGREGGRKGGREKENMYCTFCTLAGTTHVNMFLMLSSRSRIQAILFCTYLTLSRMFQMTDMVLPPSLSSLKVSSCCRALDGIEVNRGMREGKKEGKRG